MMIYYSGDCRQVYFDCSAGRVLGSSSGRSVEEISQINCLNVLFRFLILFFIN